MDRKTNEAEFEFRGTVEQLRALIGLHQSIDIDMAVKARTIEYLERIRSPVTGLSPLETALLDQIGVRATWGTQSHSLSTSPVPHQLPSAPTAYLPPAQTVIQQPQPEAATMQITMQADRDGRFYLAPPKPPLWKRLLFNRRTAAFAGAILALILVAKLAKTTDPAIPEAAPGLILPAEPIPEASPQSDVDVVDPRLEVLEQYFDDTVVPNQ